MHEHRDSRRLPRWLLKFEIWVVVRPILVIALDREVDVETAALSKTTKYSGHGHSLFVVDVVWPSQLVTHSPFHANKAPAETLKL